MYSLTHRAANLQPGGLARIRSSPLGWNMYDLTSMILKPGIGLPSGRRSAWITGHLRSIGPRCISSPTNREGHRFCACELPILRSKLSPSWQVRDSCMRALWAQSVAVTGSESRPIAFNHLSVMYVEAKFLPL